MGRQAILAPSLAPSIPIWRLALRRVSCLQIQKFTTDHLGKKRKKQKNKPKKIRVRTKIRRVFRIDPQLFRSTILCQMSFANLFLGKTYEQNRRRLETLGKEPYINVRTWTGRQPALLARHRIPEGYRRPFQVPCREGARKQDRKKKQETDKNRQKRTK